MRFDVTTQAAPEQVLRALTDFTERRPQIWNKTLDPKKYELRELGDTWAVALEATAGSPFWVVARYDWSDPSMVRWTVDESSYGGGGTGSVRIAPAAGGGSRLEAEWSYTDPQRSRDKVMLWMLHHGPMSRVIARMWADALDRYAESDPG